MGYSVMWSVRDVTPTYTVLLNIRVMGTAFPCPETLLLMIIGII